MEDVSPVTILPATAKLIGNHQQETVILEQGIPHRPTRTRLTLTRRDFIGRCGAGSIATTVLAGCQAMRSPSPAPGTSTTLKPVVIDTHTHFYDPTRPQGVPWPPRSDPLLYRTVLPRDYLALPTPQPVTGTVVVEASPWVEDNQWILDLAARERFIVGFVGNLPLGSSECASHLERFAANPLFRGLRTSGQHLAAGLNDPAWMADVRRLVSRELSLDLVGGMEMLPSAGSLAKALPELRIVIDHLAGLRIDGQTPPDHWRQAMKAVAAHANVYCKVSGLVEGAGRGDAPSPRAVDFYRPVFDTIWELFGEDRLVYGSNWPVSDRFAALDVVQGIVGDYFGGKGPQVLAKVFGKNAQAVYRWIPRPS